MVMPSFPYPEVGAEQIDRAEGIRQLVRLGCAVVVVAKVTAWADEEAIQQWSRNLGVRTVLVPYRYSNRTLSRIEKIQKFLGKLRNPLYFDGAAYEYAEPEIKLVVANELEEFRPHVVWFEYTYLWPLYSLVRRAGVPIITRSANFEPDHFLQEQGKTMLSLIQYVFKYISERRAARWSDLVFAITPHERERYIYMGARRVETLPLRGLPALVGGTKHLIGNKSPLHVFFMGASYTVAHNRAAAAQVINEIASQIERRAQGEFVFHILGGKLPEYLQKKCDGVTVVHEGYVPDLDVFLKNMDIACIPSLMGAGMQQKVFEPMVRGFPTITSPRAIAGYDFMPGKQYVNATTSVEFVNALLQLRDPAHRVRLGQAATDRTVELFSQEVLDETVLAGLSAFA